MRVSLRRDIESVALSKRTDFDGFMVNMIGDVDWVSECDASGIYCSDEWNLDSHTCTDDAMCNDLLTLIKAIDVVRERHGAQSATFRVMQELMGDISIRNWIAVSLFFDRKTFESLKYQKYRLHPETNIRRHLQEAIDALQAPPT